MSTGPENTAARVALWRALHVEIDSAPHVLEDTVGLRLLAPDGDWRARPDMHPQGTARFRAGIVARARFVEDLVVASGAKQYVILGAGLDTFAQRRPDVKIRIFEVDQPAPQAWKRGRLEALGLPLPTLVPVDFEAGASWWDELLEAGFDPKAPAVVAATGVSMYLSREANAAMLRQAATLAPGSSFVSTFMLPFDLLDAEERPGVERAAAGARANGTPFISFFSPDAMLALARECGLREVEVFTTERYFADRADGLRPSLGEQLLVAKT